MKRRNALTKMLFHRTNFNRYKSLPIKSLPLFFSSSSLSRSNWYEKLHQLSAQSLKTKPTKEVTMSDGIVASCNENSDKCILLFSNSTEPSLKNWVYDQRNLYNKKNKKYFNHEKIDLLNKKNFIWDVHEFIWNIRLNELREFRGKHGHCIVSRSYKHLPNLGLWVYNQRNRKQNQEKDTPLSEVGSLTNKQIKYLDDLNFVWNTDEAKWLEKFNALKDFYNKNGHTHLADSNCSDKSLVYWVKRQRRECTMENRKKNARLYRIYLVLFRGTGRSMVRKV